MTSFGTADLRGSATPLEVLVQLPTSNVLFRCSAVPTRGDAAGVCEVVRRPIAGKPGT